MQCKQRNNKDTNTSKHMLTKQITTTEGTNARYQLPEQ